MKYLNPNSLFQTIDNVSEALLFNFEIEKAEKQEIADFIVGQQNKPHAYANTFAPTESDLKKDLVLFTGEKITTGAGKCHMAGEEASRVLRKLGIHNEKIRQALQKADNGMLEMVLNLTERYGYVDGTYCCNPCSCSLWINLASGGIPELAHILPDGLAYLKSTRDGKGRWKGFPYYYIIYVLNEIGPELAHEEMEYTAPYIEKKLNSKKSTKPKYDLRRNYICEQLLKKVG